MKIIEKLERGLRSRRRRPAVDASAGGCANLGLVMPQKCEDSR
jgi:hypothetical protein